MRSLIRKALKRSLLNVWPSDLSAQLLYETTASARHFKSWLFARSRFHGKRDLKLNIGCGKNIAPDWLNIDLDGPPGVFRWDCRRGMPFDEASVRSIFAEHVFEHFDPATGLKFLSECYRCLKPGGIVRIVVPDVGRYLQLYQCDWSAIAAIRPLIEENGRYRDFWLDRIYNTKMEFMNEIFRQGTQHKYAYDAETLMLKFREAGFSQIIHQSYGISASTDRPLDTKARGAESLYVEAKR
jgi:predicted SAM-dependent methyltransferase